MPARPIVRLGHPALRIPAQPVAPGQLALPATQELIDDMIETMRAASGVGLAAPQVGVGLQLFVYEAALREDRDPGIPLRAVINPMLTPQSGEMVYDWEGCLSIPDLRGLVPRHPAVRVHGLDRLGQPLDYLATGFEARIVQHEFDHLHAVVFLDRMRDFKTLAFYDEWERYMVGPAAENDENDEDDEIYEAGDPEGEPGDRDLL
ncbi:MAG: peptide deformylase [Acidobacteriota bacterium]|jgi:peptide deformylase|nr:peptide deformylase [Acidobacteriota bacterium]